ncbi:MAG: hypothetical protein NT124_01245 [Candidatus Dependentiae bacterium]|nr:hypothetical protein [Candidatus Dependentiae bacterium]
MIKKKYRVLVGLLLVSNRCVVCAELLSVSDTEQESVTFLDNKVNYAIEPDYSINPIDTDGDTHEYDAICSFEPESKSSAWKLMLEEVGFYVLSTCVRVHLCVTKKYQSLKHYIHRLTHN